MMFNFYQNIRGICLWVIMLNVFNITPLLSENNPEICYDKDTFCSETLVNQIPGEALDCSSNNQRIDVPDNVNGSLDITTTITIEFWCKLDPTTFDQGIFALKSGTYGISHYNGTLQFHPKGYNDIHYTNVPIPINQWAHIAATYDGRTSKIYLNGVLAASRGMVGSIPVNDGTLYISGDGCCPGFNYGIVGELDELRIWNKALCEDEVQAYMNCEISTAPGLVASYHFNQGEAGDDNSNPAVDMLMDDSGFGNNGTMNNFPLMGTDGNWVAPGGVTVGNTCTLVDVPEIDILGGAGPTSIKNFNNVLSTVDDTNYGEVAVNSTTDHTFTIRNTGNLTLNLTGTPIVDFISNPTGFFSILTQPSGNSIANGGADLTFTVRYNPTAVGNHEAIVNIASDDCDETLYQFLVGGVTPGCNFELFNTSTSDETCATNDGSVTINANCYNCANGNTDLEYSIDGTNFQDGASFSMLTCGSYTAYVRHKTELCTISEPFNINMEACGTGAFTTTWEVNDLDLSVTIPAPTFFGYTYDFNVDWGDGTVTNNHTSDATYTYASAGIKTITVTGMYPHLYIGGSGFSNYQKFRSVEQWGDNQWESLYFAFGFCTFDINATDVPDLSICTDFRTVFVGANFTGDISKWNVSNIGIFEGMFAASNFNQDISGWNFSNAYSMREMFNNCGTFNQDLSNWVFNDYVDMTSIFRNSGLSIENYDKMLHTWANRANPPAFVNMSFQEGVFYCQSEDDRAVLINNYQWNISEDATLGIDTEFSAIVGESCAGTMDGSINVLLPGCIDVGCQNINTMEFSINSGPFQPEPLFENLAAGTYTIEVRDIAMTCSAQASFDVPLGPDLVAPDIMTQNITRDLDGSGMINITSADIDVGSIDNCTAEHLLLFEFEKSSFSCQDLNGVSGTPCTNVTTIAGDHEETGAVDATGAAARFNTAFDIAFGPDGNIYVADWFNHAIRKVTPAGVVTTFAGTLGVSGFQDGTGTDALFFRPAGLDFDAAGNLYVSDGNNRVIRKITPAGVVTRVAGSAQFGHVDGPALDARFGTLRGLAVDKNTGDVYVADGFQHTIRKLTPAGQVVTVAGVAGQAQVVDGVGTNARFNFPRALAVDNSGNVYITEFSGHVIRKMTTSGVVTTIAGMPSSSGFSNGTGTDAAFSFPSGIDVDEKGVLYVADQSNTQVRRISPSGVVSTLAGRTGSTDYMDGLGTVATMRPISLTLDADGNIYTCRHTVRKIELIDNCFSSTVTVKDENDNAASALFNVTISNPEVCDADPTAFVTTWTVEASDLDITIPTSPASTYNYTVDWGDSSLPTNHTGDATHTYPAAGNYTVQITGTFPHFNMNGNPPGSETANQLKLASIEQWGNIAWESMENAFRGATKMQYNATDAPDLSSVTNISNMFRNTLVTGDLTGWTTTGVQNMSGAFYGIPLSVDISNWDVSSVTDMSKLFMYSGFVGNVSSWTPNMVTDMSDMFAFSDFDGDISSWNTAMVQNMAGMFNEATNFNQNLASLDLTGLNNINSLTNFLTLSGLSTENYDLSLVGWATQSVLNGLIVGVHELRYCAGMNDRQTLKTSFGWDFQGDDIDADNVCNDLPFVTKWETSGDNESITIFTDDFYVYEYDIDWGDNSPVETGLTGDATHEYATAGEYTVTISGEFPHFRADGGQWYPLVSNAAKLNSIEQWGSIEWHSMQSAFSNAHSMVYNAPDVPRMEKVANMSSMFYRAKSFNGNLDDWDVSNVNHMGALFYGATSFNGEILKWETGHVRTMNLMFWNADQFNQDISTWDVSSVRDMRSMFEYAFNFDQDLSGWDFSSIAYRQALNYAFSFSNLSVANYDNLLIRLQSQEADLPINVVLGAHTLQYCTGETARNALIANLNWTITDSGVFCPRFGSDNDNHNIWNTSSSNWSPIFRVFPNPTEDRVSILLGPTDTPYQSATIHNQMGQLLWSQELNSGATTFDVSLRDAKFTSGIYYVNVLMKDRVLTRKLMVVK